MLNVATQPIMLKGQALASRKASNNVLIRRVCRETLKTVTNTLAEQCQMLKGWKDVRVLEISKVTQRSA